jgi:[protein-PII] uridylyltransferase
LGPRRVVDIDAWLAGLLGDEEGVALLAVGSYGRADLAPFSDLDLVLVHRGRRDVKELADRVWYPIWDRGLGLDHSVRTVKEVLAVADADLKAALGLLEGRLVAGDEAIAADLLERVLAQWRKRAGRWLPMLAQAVEERHARFGEVAFLLEPDLKEGRGGLRDVNVLRAAALATPVIGDRLEALHEPYRVLCRVRAELHLRAGKPLDRLLLQEQDAVAAALGHPDAEALVAEVASAGRTVAYVSDDCWRRVRSSLAGPRGRVAPADRPVGPGLLLREGEVTAADPASYVQAAAVAAGLGAPLARATLARFATDAPPAPTPWSDALRSAFVALLGAGPAALPVMEALDQHGLLVRLLPEWDAVRHRPQRNAYHRFTVDRHLLETAARAASLTRRVSRPDLLLVGALLHDIGKGFPGDHTEAGVEVMARVATRMGFPAADVATLVSLVRHHLLLSHVATRRDLDDPATVEHAAAAVGDRGTLELLAALTEADSLATGPSAWSEWKAGLVAELVARTLVFIDGRAAGHPAPEPSPLAVPDVPPGVPVHLEGQGRTCTVVAPDRPGLFSRVAGVLTLNGLDVLSAQAGPAGDDRAVEVFEVEPAFGGEPDWARVAADLEAALDGRLPLETRLAERARLYASRYRLTAARPAEPRVLVDNRVSAKATVIEVRAPDGMGVLYRITRALANCGLDVRFARVSTLGHEVVDAFYVVDAEGATVTDPDALGRVAAAVAAALGGEGG